jgi:hypothetical protein
MGKARGSKEHKLIRESWHKFARAASFEWFLTPTRPNGGDIVLARALCVALEMAAIALVLHNLVDPELGWTFSFAELRTQVLELAPWFVAAAGAAYAALYARFSSQWGYLASLYNQIKQEEIELLHAGSSSPQEASRRLAQWKAGYIEDAGDLHLHTKANIAGIIHFWGSDPDVSDSFIKWAPGGQKRWDQIRTEAEMAFTTASKKYE